MVWEQGGDKRLWYSCVAHECDMWLSTFFHFLAAKLANRFFAKACRFKKKKLADVVYLCEAGPIFHKGICRLQPAEFIIIKSILIRRRAEYFYSLLRKVLHLNLADISLFFLLSYLSLEQKLFGNKFLYVFK